MGGGGGWNFSNKDLNKLEQAIKDTVKQTVQSTKKNVFLSFAFEDIDHVNLLRGQAKNQNNDLEFNDWSLREPFDSKNADYIRRGIRERIRQSSVTLVFLSDDSATSQWVNWEIKESAKLGKKVIGMYGKRMPKAVPPALREIGAQIVPWSHEAIRNALRD